MGDIGWGLLVYLGASTVVGVVAVFMAMLVNPDLLDTAATGDSAALLDALGIGVILASAVGGWVGLIGWPVLASYRKGARSLKADYGLAFRGIDVAWGVGGAVVILAGSAALGALWSVVTGTDLPSNEGMLGTSWTRGPALVATFLVVAVGTPFAEELFFRGLALRAIARRFGPVWGIVGSSIVFGALHATGADSPAGLAVVPIMTGLYGAVFAVVAHRTGRLGGAIIAHGCINAVALLGVVLATG